MDCVAAALRNKLIITTTIIGITSTFNISGEAI